MPEQTLTVDADELRGLSNSRSLMIDLTISYPRLAKAITDAVDPPKPPAPGWYVTSGGHTASISNYSDPEGAIAFAERNGPLTPMIPLPTVEAIEGSLRRRPQSTNAEVAQAIHDDLTATHCKYVEVVR